MTTRYRELHHPASVPMLGLLGPSLSRAGHAAAAPDTGPGWLARALRRMRRDHAARRAADELARLDDRMLRDIGLQRSDIRAVATAVAARRFTPDHVLAA